MTSNEKSAEGASLAALQQRIVELEQARHSTADAVGEHASIAALLADRDEMTVYLKVEALLNQSEAAEQRLAEVTRELDEAKAETERQHGHRFRLAGEVGSLRAALDSQTQRACRFNCDAESKNCSCAAHVARNEVLAALAAPAAGTPEQAAPEHVCGLAGYDGMIDKPCPACEFYRVKRAAAGTEPTAPAADPQE